VEVIAGIFYRRNHRGIQKHQLHTMTFQKSDEHADRITEGFKMSALYGDETGSTMKNTDEITEGFKTAAPYGDETGSQMTNTDGITEGFKTAALYGDEIGSQMTNTDGITEGFKTAAPYVTCPIYRQNSGWNPGRNSPSAKVNISPISPSSSSFSSSSQLSPTANNQPPSQKKSPSSQHNKLYILKSSCHNICVLIYLWIFISFCK